MSRKRSKSRKKRPPAGQGSGDGKPSSPPRRRGRRRTAAVGLMAVVAAGGFVLLRGSFDRPEGRGPGFNVLLITLDTTRADHLGCYGHPDEPTPHIDRLAGEGTRFAECTSAAPSTLPSHATIMTGTYPYVHGVRHNVGYRLSEANVTLAEAFQRADYHTAAFVGAYVVNRDTGLDQGFDLYDDTGTRHERRGDDVCRRAIDWLDARADDKFFLWVHFFDPHFPYDPPRSLLAQYPTPYVGEIAFVDEQVGRLLGTLRRLDLEDRTLVVLTTDHGEGLGQHHEGTHLYYTYDTTMSVPLIFRCPTQIPVGGLIRTQVRTIDIAPTILAFACIESEVAWPHAQGTSLITTILAGAGDADLPAYGETLAGQIVLGTSALRCVRADGWKYIHAPRPELYYVREDPGELQNLAGEQPARVQAMCDQLRDIIDGSPEPVSLAGAATRPDQATLDRLQSLGYASGDTTTAPSSVRELDLLEPTGKDPKDHAGDFHACSQGMHSLQSGRYAEAEAVYRRLASTFPQTAELSMQLARAIFLQGRFEDAIAVYRNLLHRHAGNARVHYGLGKLLDRVGKRGEAIEHLVAATQLAPDFPEAHYDLGVALRKEGHNAQALECFRQALRVRPSYVDARLNLGVGLAAQGMLDQAIEQYREALRIAPNDALVHHNLGNALLRSGKRAEAIRAYKEALRLDPGFVAARQALNAAEQL